MRELPARHGSASSPRLTASHSIGEGVERSLNGDCVGLGVGHLSCSIKCAT